MNTCVPATRGSGSLLNVHSEPYERKDLANLSSTVLSYESALCPSSDLSVDVSMMFLSSPPSVSKAYTLPPLLLASISALILQESDATICGKSFAIDVPYLSVSLKSERGPSRETLYPVPSLSTV